MRSDKHQIATTTRFLYLNIYAFLLLLLGGGAIVISLLWARWYIIVVAAIVALVCFRGAIVILSGWSDKKRKYDLLITRNKTELRPDTFAEFMKAPCGRLLVRVVLTDLDIPNQYKILKSLRPPLRQRIRNECRQNRKKTVVHIINDKTENKL